MWSRRCASVAPAVAAAVLLAACGSAPVREEAPATQVVPTKASASAAATAPQTVPPASPAAAPAASAGAVPAAAAAAAPPVAPPPLPEPPKRAIADFERAVGLMRAGKTTDAELEFQQIAVAYPQFAAADINLGLLYRKIGQLDRSEQALRAAVERESANPVAWTELGVTLRLRGQFKDAGEAYNRAIAADAGYAPAYRNLGVLLDLYQGDPVGALSAYQRYKELSGEDKPVSSWIAEVRVRAGKAVPAPPKDAAPASDAAPGNDSAPAKDAAAPKSNGG